MNDKITEIIDRIKSLEHELENELHQAQEHILYQLKNDKIYFDKAIAKQHKAFKTGLLRYVLAARPQHFISVPFIYAVFPSLLLLDLSASVYQAICFPLYGITKVKRNDYLIFDRQHLGYLNLLERFNCFYCSYANGLLSYLKEIVGRTEQYWCPIKHAKSIKHAHASYAKFLAYGDAEAYQNHISKLRHESKTDESPSKK